ncbi:CpsD/CapB family tyrosine-protein kinase [uncultured Paludibaculum sp.]|uniref:CpsD/CapB family tyrosine-protein kinase n=1 Tax=uncultured Paludibaculum sp. TaxID=1765020 RepID=UPI002AAA8DD6|nr:CpsD/CapB family tyrosine-protein kinase [uncultured Paludibaculum sp.]
MTKPRMSAMDPLGLSEAMPAMSSRAEGKGLGLRGVVSPAESVAMSVSDGELQAAARVKLSLGATGKVFAVTGLAPGDGSADLAVRLGAALAAVEPAPVLLVDGSVAEPTQAAAFGLPAKPGLLEVLRGDVELSSAVHSVGPPNLSVLPLGKGDASLASLLAGPNAATVLAQIRDRYRYVVIEVGLVQKAPDALLLAAMTDGVVVAAATGDRRRHELQGLKQDLDRMKIPLLGVVLTTGGGRSKR